MKTGQPCHLCDGRMHVYHTRRNGDHKVRFLRCSTPDCPTRGKQVLYCSEPVRRREYQNGTHLADSALSTAEPSVDLNHGNQTPIAGRP